MPAESKDFIDLRSRLASGEHGDEYDRQARLLLETHDGLWRTKRLLRHSNIENRVLYLIAIGLAVWVGVLVSSVQHLQSDQVAGRKISLGVTCSVLGAIAESGKATISTPIGGPSAPALERGLRNLGFPPFEIRKQQAKLAGEAYVDSIAGRVQQETGVTNLVREDGTINCDRLRALAKLNLALQP